MTQEKQSIPDIYSDRFNVNTDPLGVQLALALSNVPPKQGAEPMVVLRFSLQNWKTILMTGRKHLKTHETRTGAAIHLPKELLDSLQLTEADW